LKSNKPRYNRSAAWFGLLALALNALVPIHIAFDLAEALEAAESQPAHREPDGAERRILALLTGHHEEHGKSDEHGKHHGAIACPVCSTLGALGGFALPLVVALPLPPPADLPATATLIAGEPGASPLAYRSRAPPLA
jgi:DUF2946 family protein